MPFRASVSAVFQDSALTWTGAPGSDGSSTAQCIIRGYHRGYAVVKNAVKKRSFSTTPTRATQPSHDFETHLVMHVTVVSPFNNTEVAGALADLGCSIRECSPLENPSVICGETDVVLVRAADDGDLGAFVVRRVRACSQTIPVLVAIEVSQLSRLDPSWGHDDFVLMPVIPHELLARIRAIEWNKSDFSQPDRIKAGELVIDIEAHHVTVAGRQVSMTQREFELLVELANHRGTVLRRATILADIWKVKGIAAQRAGRSLDVHVRRLRTKLSGYARIETVRGVGFRFDSA